MLDQVDPSAMDVYGALIERFATRYPDGEPVWTVLYQAEVRMRSEHMERIRRTAIATNPPGYDEARPWNYVWRQA
eukprot:12997205-Heterocapsa_arctica.AAC.1